MNPFDLKTVLLARHAQHVVLIHFPIVLFIVSVAFDFAAHWSKKRVLAAVAYYNLMVAAVAALPVLATGVLAWQWQLGGQKLKGILLIHLVLGLTSSALIWFALWLHVRANRRPASPLPTYRLSVELLAVKSAYLSPRLLFSVASSPSAPRRGTRCFAGIRFSGARAIAERP